MAIFVVGANGMLGRRIIEVLADRFPVTPVSTSATDGRTLRLDLRAPHDFDYEAISPGDVVVLAAAISSPDRCAKEFEFAHTINVTGTTVAIERCVARGARVIFFSSDVVLGNTSEEVFEDATVHPVGAYGAMKAEVEARFTDTPEVKVLRLSYVISDDDNFLKYLAACLDTGEPAKVFTALERRIVTADDVVAVVEAFCGDGPGTSVSLVNLAGPDLLSRKDLADIYAEATGRRLKVETAEPPPGFFDARPPVINMGSRHLETLLGRPPLTAASKIAAVLCDQPD